MILSISFEHQLIPNILIQNARDVWSKDYQELTLIYQDKIFIFQNLKQISSKDIEITDQRLSRNNTESSS